MHYCYFKYCTGENYMQKRKTNIALHWVEISNRRARVLLNWVKEKKLNKIMILTMKKKQNNKIYLFVYIYEFIGSYTINILRIGQNA